MQDYVVSVGKKRLPASFHPPKGVNLNTALIICHGFRGSKDGGGRAVRLAERAAALGLSVLRFAFSPTETLSSQLDELGAMVDYCRNNICSRIILLGRSMGGSCALAFAASDQQISGLCLWATPSDLFETFQLSLGDGYKKLINGVTLEFNDEYGYLKMTPDFIDDFKNYDLLSSIQKVKSPVLILHGSDDAVVPLHQAKRLWELANEPKQLKIIEGGDHQLAQHANLAADIVIDWLKAGL